MASNFSWPWEMGMNSHGLMLDTGQRPRRPMKRCLLSPPATTATSAVPRGPILRHTAPEGGFHAGCARRHGTGSAAKSR